MATYATVDDVMRPPYLDQIGQENRAGVQPILEAVTTRFNNYLGFRFDLAAEAGVVVYGDGSDTLKLPAFVAGSIVSVTAPGGEVVPSYIESDGTLVILRYDRRQKRYNGYAVASAFDKTCEGWASGVPYTVTAEFGWAAVPADIKQACIVETVREWLAARGGFSDVVGVEGAGIVRTHAFTVATKQVLDSYKLQSGGVW